MKCQYLDELTGGHGVVFATGTPISNTMVEMYTMQKYLQYDTLRRNDLIHFDSWASTFGETVTAIELAPEGTGYRAKTRFAKFFNLPELMTMFKEVADIQTADMLKLPVPKANYHNVVLKPSELQKKMVDGVAERAEKVRAGMVNSSQDNMLVITNDGRKLALDQRLMNELLPESETGKVAACAQNVFEIWQRTADQDVSHGNDGEDRIDHGDRGKIGHRGRGTRFRTACLIRLCRFAFVERQINPPGGQNNEGSQEGNDVPPDFVKSDLRQLDFRQKAAEYEIGVGEQRQDHQKKADQNQQTEQYGFCSLLCAFVFCLIFLPDQERETGEYVDQADQRIEQSPNEFFQLCSRTAGFQPVNGQNDE